MEPHQRGQARPPRSGLVAAVARRRAPLLWTLLAVATVVILCCGGLATFSLMSGAGKGGDGRGAPAVQRSGGPATHPAPRSTGVAAAPAAPTGPGPGHPVRDGTLEFVVQPVRCGPPAGTRPGQQARMLCRVPLTVRNIGRRPHLFDQAWQKAFTASGAEYSIGDVGALHDSIAPGRSLVATLTYDVPTGTGLTRVELHDSPFSGGVGVRLA